MQISPIYLPDSSSYYFLSYIQVGMSCVFLRALNVSITQSHQTGFQHTKDCLTPTERRWHLLHLLAPLQVLVTVHLKSRTPFLAASHTTKKPVCQTDKLGAHPTLPVPAGLDVLDGMTQDPPLAVKLKKKQSREAIRRSRFVDLEVFAKGKGPSYARRACGSPSHH